VSKFCHSPSDISFGCGAGALIACVTLFIRIPGIINSFIVNIFTILCFLFLYSLYEFVIDIILFLF
ncbi:hypothetical protein OM198_23500, partial [Escherichia albertii]|nr:hypothetical protein [Escherichia albertii]